MAFSDILRAVQCGFTDAADLIDGVEGRTTPVLYYAEGTTLVSRASTTTYNTISGLEDTIAGVSASDLILEVSVLTISASDAADVWYIEHHADGAAAGQPAIWKTSSSDSSGKLDTITVFSVWSGLSGSVDFATKWATAEATGSGTAYSRRRYHTLIHFKGA